MKTSSSKSVPNIPKSSSGLIRSKTGISLKGSKAVKRIAATTENTDAPAVKQSKVAPKTGQLIKKNKKTFNLINAFSLNFFSQIKSNYKIFF